MQSSSSVLSFYFDMLFVNSIQSVKDSFLGNSTLQENGYSYLQEHNYYLKDEMVEDNGSMPVFVTDIISREDFLDRLLNFENTSIYRTIQTEISTRETEQDKTTYITKVYDDIQVLLRRVLKLEDNEGQLKTSLLNFFRIYTEPYFSFYFYLFTKIQIKNVADFAKKHKPLI